MPIVRLEMLSGRSQEQLNELAEVLTRETARIARCKTTDVQVVISEFDRSRWAVGGVIGKPATTPS
ncbi:tautomerase family protein [Pseudomonas putida]|uniref:tautomerase family protein n=1 Tax=Pseudomonas putida TaxID=303 RepID=UPI00390642D3